MASNPREYLAVAMDVPALKPACDLADALDGAAGWLKIGAELFTAAGPAAIEMARMQAKVFLDTKLHDIPNTVASAVAAATHHGVGMLTLHAAGGLAMLSAARQAAENAAAKTGRARPKLVAVTVLTSFAPDDLKMLGVSESLPEHVARFVDLALRAGLDGVVASPWEAAAIRAQAGPDFFLVTPGVRRAADAAGDQSRIATPQLALAAGSNLLVVGRPIVQAPSPAQAAREFVREIGSALEAK